MRPMTDTRKRRLSDTQLLANKRLSNGCSKTDHVTTRSQAKIEPSSRVSPARKVKHKQLTTEERRLMISMRLRHEEKNTTQASLNNQDDSARKFPKSRNRLLLSTSSRANGLSRLKSPPGNKVRTKFFSSVNNHQNDCAKSMDRQVLDNKHREARAKKRRSALWVLNCEAEEFLFGETAAEDREVELPPILSPPTKRRRMRATELGDLLKETPLLESKLRHPPAFSESEASTTPSETSSRKRKEKKSRGSRTNNSTRVKQKLQLMSSFSDEDEIFEDDENVSNLDYPHMNVTYAFMLEAANQSITRDSSSSQSVRIQRILDSIEFTFSFESVPSCEVWYRTFCHQDRPRNPFLSPTDSPVILPYETKGLTRESENRIRRPPRKSPRCHASTQAILSSLKPTRGRGGLSSLRMSLTPSPPPLATTPSSKSKTITSTSHIQEISVSKTSSSTTAFQLVSHSHLLRNSGGQESRHNNACPIVESQSVTFVVANGLKACEMTATQYLWDSIQFLSDPYVINVLSLSERSVKSRPPNLNKIFSTNLEVIERNLKRTNLKDSLKLVIPSPKASPRFMVHQNQIQANGSYTKSEQTDLSRRNLISPVCSGKSRILRSPPSSPPIMESRALTSPLFPIIRKSTRKAPATSDLPVSVKQTHINCTPSKFKSPASAKLFPCPLILAQEEEVLFSLSMEALPDFPWEGFT